LEGKAFRDKTCSPTAADRLTKDQRRTNKSTGTPQLGLGEGVFYPERREGDE